MHRNDGDRIGRPIDDLAGTMALREQVQLVGAEIQIEFIMTKEIGAKQSCNFTAVG